MYLLVMNAKNLMKFTIDLYVMSTVYVFHRSHIYFALLHVKLFIMTAKWKQQIITFKGNLVATYLFININFSTASCKNLGQVQLVSRQVQIE